MSLFACFSSHPEKKASRKPHHGKNKEWFPSTSTGPFFKAEAYNFYRKLISQPTKPETNSDPTNKIASQNFSFRDLAVATRNFRQETLIGEGGFGRVYKGKIEKTNQDVAVKQLDRNGFQGNKEFLVEVLMLSLLHHDNLVNLVGYCADGDQRLLVYEYLPTGSVEDHLLDVPPDQKPLDWNTRMSIALGVAKGLKYLHEKINPPVIFRDLKPANILLDKDFNAKLSDFGVLAKVGPTGHESHVSSRVMGTYGYCAPEYQRTGQLTVKSNVYSFGVVLLELITGKRVIDTTRSTGEQDIIPWAHTIFKSPHRHPELVDPLLKGKFPLKALNQVVAMGAMCLNEEAADRPSMSEVVNVLSFLEYYNDDKGDDEDKVETSYESQHTHDANKQASTTTILWDLINAN